MDLRQLDQRSVGLRLLAQLGPRVRRGPTAAGRRVRSLLPPRPVAGSRRAPAGGRAPPLLVPGRGPAPAFRVRAHLPVQPPARQSHPRRQRPLGQRRVHVQFAVGGPGAGGPGGLHLSVGYAGGAHRRVGLGHPNRGRPGAGPARPGRRDERSGQLVGLSRGLSGSGPGLISPQGRWRHPRCDARSGPEGPRWLSSECTAASTAAAGAGPAGNAEAETRPYWARSWPVIRVTAVQVCGSGMRNTPYRRSVTGRAYWRWSRAAE